jgi:DNA-binding response OmpR family regulator
MKKIFFVEDDEYLGRVYERAFRFAGYDVQLLQDGELAWKALQDSEQLPDIIIMDIMLPKVNGYDLLCALRKQNRFDTVPVAMLTNSFAEHDQEKFLSAGADLYMVKIENQTKDIVRQIEELISKGRTKQSTNPHL